MYDDNYGYYLRQIYTISGLGASKDYKYLTCVFTLKSIVNTAIDLLLSDSNIDEFSLTVGLETPGPTISMVQDASRYATFNTYHVSANNTCKGMLYPHAATTLTCTIDVSDMITTLYLPYSIRVSNHRSTLTDTISVVCDGFIVAHN